MVGTPDANKSKDLAHSVLAVYQQKLGAEAWRDVSILGSRMNQTYRHLAPELRASTPVHEFCHSSQVKVVKKFSLKNNIMLPTPCPRMYLR